MHFPLRFSASSSTKRKGKRLFCSTQIPFLYKILKSKNENIRSRILNFSVSSLPNDAIHFTFQLLPAQSEKKKGKRLFCSTQIRFLYKLLKSKNENIHSRIFNFSQSLLALSIMIFRFFQHKAKG